MILDSEKLKFKMQEKFFTNVTLAAAAQMSATTVNKARHGADLTPATLKKLCNALQCEPKDLIKE